MGNNVREVLRVDPGLVRGPEIGKVVQAAARTWDEHDGGASFEKTSAESSNPPSRFTNRELAQVRRPGFIKSAPMARILAKVLGEPDPIERYIETAKTTEAGAKAFRLLRSMNKAVQGQPEKEVKLAVAKTFLEELAAKRESKSDSGSMVA